MVGVDISPEMVQLAQSQQDKEGPDIDYRVSDCCRAEFLEEFKDNFDVVTATYLLNYATNVDMIQSFTDSAFTVLQPGGRFIGINTNPFIKTREDFMRSHKYDIEYTTETDCCEEGDPLHIKINGRDFEASFDNYFWEPRTYELAF